MPSLHNRQGKTRITSGPRSPAGPGPTTLLQNIGRHLRWPSEAPPPTLARWQLPAGFAFEPPRLPPALEIPQARRASPPLPDCGQFARRKERLGGHMIAARSFLRARRV